MITLKNGTLCLLLAGLLLSGCSTIDSRIKEKSAVFAELTPEQQQVIRNGFIAIGYTTDMVYMALDKPEKVVPGANGDEESWIYHNFYSADGSGLGAPTKITTHTKAMGTRGGNVNALGGQSPNNTFTVDYDHTAETIKSEAAIKVHVKFVDQKVANIEIVGGH